MSSITSRIRNAWNAFISNKDPTSYRIGPSDYRRPDRVRLTRGNERSIITGVINRIGIDVASINIKHVKVDAEGRFEKQIFSGLNNCLTTSANIDQTGRAFIQDTVMSMLDEGVVAIVPIDTFGDDPRFGQSYEIKTMRTGKITQWYPKHVKVKLYDENTGLKKEVVFPKSMCAIIENPLFSIMNEPNSTYQRLVHKLNLLDRIDNMSGSNKLDLIIQLPYVVRTKSQEIQAENRRKDIEKQLTESEYGIVYTDGTEKITQLNRSVENKLLNQIEFLTSMLYGQLGITAEVLNGTANETVMLNYYNRTIEPIISAITDEFNRKFLTKTARAQGQKMLFFRDPFRLVPVNNIAEIADKFTRNEILTSNEIRQILGMIPSKDPKADELINSNIRQAEENPNNQEQITLKEENQNDV